MRIVEVSYHTTTALARIAMPRSSTRTKHPDAKMQDAQCQYLILTGFQWQQRPGISDAVIDAPGEPSPSPRVVGKGTVLCAGVVLWLSDRLNWHGSFVLEAGS